MDAYEPSHNGVDHHNHDSVVPEVGEPDTLSQDEPGHEEDCSHAKDMGNKSVVLHGRVRANEGGASFADLFALSGRVTEGNSGHVYVRVSIGSDKVEEACEAAAGIEAGSSDLGAAGLGMADKELHDEGGDFEESVEE